MIETLQALPGSFWIAIVILLLGIVVSLQAVRRSYGIPMLAVLITVSAWYMGDVINNDYTNHHALMFSDSILWNSWLQVSLFLSVFIFLAPFLHQKINRRHLRRPSQLLLMYKHGVAQKKFQRGLTLIFWPVFWLWILLLGLALYTFEDRFPSYLFPYFGKHPGPWVKNGIATGGMDSILALAGYFQIMCGAVFGVVAALSTNNKIRSLAIIGVFFTWPYYIFDRTRKSIMAIVIPGVTSWIFLRVRARFPVKLAIAGAAFLLVSAWFGFVGSHRSDSTIAAAFVQDGFNLKESVEEKHQGLNMYEELCWINTLTNTGEFNPNWGVNYLANLANPIPRLIWPNKPTIGLDYAIARGLGGGDGAAGVWATMANGLIGQGVVNFGIYLGPAFVALLMGLWVSWLARLDLMGQKIGYIPLYGLGLIITFALGRDITFLDLYPFVFGYGICWWLNRHFGNHIQQGVKRCRKSQSIKNKLTVSGRGSFGESDQPDSAL